MILSADVDNDADMSLNADDWKIKKKLQLTLKRWDEIYVQQGWKSFMLMTMKWLN